MVQDQLHATIQEKRVFPSLWEQFREDLLYIHPHAHTHTSTRTHARDGQVPKYRWLYSI